MTVRAGIYARVSTADQVEGTSLDSQLASGRAAAVARGWTVEREYVDGGISGTRTDRPQWRAMLADAQAGRLEAVIVLKLDRFGRNASHAIGEIDRLTALGVQFVSVKEAIDMSTPAGRMMRTMLAGVAEFERDTITERGVSGQRAKAIQGRWPGGEPPYGWQLEGKGRDATPAANGDEREIIRLVEGWLTRERLSSGQVANRLNDLGLSTRRGVRWTYDGLRRVFTNPTLHDGKVTWGQPNGRRAGHHAKMGPNGQPRYGAPIDIYLADPPLTLPEWRAIQRALSKGRTATRVQDRPHPLSGRLLAPCGSHYNGVTLTHSSRVVYRCHGRRHRSKAHAKCNCSQLDGLAIEAAVWAPVVDLLGNAERLEAMAQRWLRLGDVDSAASDDQLADRVNQHVARLERAQERATKELLLVDDQAPVRLALAEIKRDLDAARGRQQALIALRADAQDAGERLTDLAVLARRATARLAAMDAAAQREVLALLDVRVSIHSQPGGQQPSLVIEGSIDARLFGDESGDHNGANDPPDGGKTFDGAA